MAGRRGGKPHDLRPLADIRTTLDAGPEWLTSVEAASAVGVCEQSIYDRGNDGSILRAKTHSRRGAYTYHYHRDGIWRLALELHDADADAEAFDSSASARAAVLRMMGAWQDCETAQQLHDAAHVQPLPPADDDRGRRRPAQYEAVTCAMCEREFERVVDSQAGQVRLCKHCRSQVGKRAGAQVRAFLAWCAQP